MGTSQFPRRRRLLFVLLSIPLVTAQDPDTRTSTFLFGATLPPPIPTLAPPAPVPTEAPSSANTFLASAPSSSASSTHSGPSSARPTYTFPFPIPSGVARTASGKPIPCSPKNVKLNPSSHKLISECTETMFCAQPPEAPVNATGLGMCFPRLCRRDEYPFGYANFGGGSKLKVLQSKGMKVPDTTVDLPPMCGKGEFCPDNGSGCRLQVAVGGKCELGRDEQCALPSPSSDGGSTSNRAVCLNLSCTSATQQLNEPCKFENTTYVSDINKNVAGGGQFISFVFKHNCLSPDFFCDPTSKSPNGGGATCQRTRNLGEQCTFDAQCELGNCATPNNVCALPPQTPKRIPAWEWVAIGLFVALFMISLCLILLFIHRRHRYQQYQELRQYYHDQMSLRRSLLALHTAAAEGFFKNTGDSSFDEKQVY
ncbi:hypothetical protein NLJ89_g10955 [Agrocybe chaxingu]|uniref:Uncharacterized protein n=1 Tax=Agrocybe chaxingu TaxID=84603 RepID=A0A9W8JQ95_9AGAR|nr:hypothetical protein NLJ89_g10955 [Agrocybe chaxingu]